MRKLTIGMFVGGMLLMCGGFLAIFVGKGTFGVLGILAGSFLLIGQKIAGLYAIKK